jgi:hypothetical protein
MGYSTGPAEAGATFGPQKGAGATDVALHCPARWLTEAGAVLADRL